jgi:hypothetical protein
MGVHFRISGEFGQLALPRPRVYAFGSLRAPRGGPITLTTRPDFALDYVIKEFETHPVMAARLLVRKVTRTIEPRTRLCGQRHEGSDLKYLG